jgi:hypothetical protein
MPPIMRRSGVAQKFATEPDQVPDAPHYQTAEVNIHKTSLTAVF